MLRKPFHQQNKFKFKENQLLLKLILSLLLPSLAILIVISSFFSLTYSKESIKDIVSNSFVLLSSMIQPLDNMMESAKQTTYEIYKSPSVFPLISRDVSNQDLLKAASHLNNMLYANANIYSIYVCQQGRTVLHFGGSTLYDESDSSVHSLIENSPILRPIPRIITTKNGSLNLISIIYTNVHARTENLYVVLNLLPGIIDFSRNQEFLNEGQQMIVTDLSGNVLSHTDPNMFASNISKEEFFLESRSSTMKHGTLSMTVGQKDSVVAYLTSDNEMYMAFFISDTETFYARTTKTTNLILTFCMVILVLLITASIFISYKVYSPWNSIFSHIKGLINNRTTGEMNMVGDLRHAANAVGRVIEKLNRLAPDGNDNDRSMKNNFMFRLLSGRNGMTQGEFNMGMEKFLPLANEGCDAYQAVVLRIDGFKTFIASNSLEAVDFQFHTIEGICEDLLSESRSCHAFTNGSENIVIFLGIPAAHMELSPHSAELVKLKETVRQLFNLSITIGISSIVNSMSIDGVKDMYEDAFSYTNYRIIHGKGSIYAKNNIKASIGGPETVKELSNLIISSARNDSKEMFDKHIDCLLSDIHAFPYDSIVEILIQISDQLQNMILTFQPHNLRSARIDVGQLKQNITELEDMSQIKQFFSDQYSRIHNLLSAAKNSKASDLLTESVDYINTNYSDPNLSASLIADTLGITPQYFSKLFKQIMDMSFPDYLSDLRLEHAKNMLKDNPLMPISSVCVKTGYNSASYFSTSFSKKFGIPPSKYIRLTKETIVQMGST